MLRLLAGLLIVASFGAVGLVGPLAVRPGADIGGTACPMPDPAAAGRPGPGR